MITDRNAGVDAGISPDGRFVFYTEWVSADEEVLHLKVVPIAGGAPVLDMPLTGHSTCGGIRPAR